MKQSEIINNIEYDNDYNITRALEAKKNKKLLIIFSILLVISIALIIVGVILKMPWLYITFIIIGIISYYMSVFSFESKRMNEAMYVKCPHCDSFEITAKLNKSKEKKGTIYEFEEFTCNNCKKSWDNSSMIDRVNLLTKKNIKKQP